MGKPISMVGLKMERGTGAFSVVHKRRGKVQQDFLLLLLSPDKRTRPHSCTKALSLERIVRVAIKGPGFFRNLASQGISRLFQKGERRLSMFPFPRTFHQQGGSASRGHNIICSEHVGAVRLDACIRALLWSAYGYKVRNSSIV